MKKLRDSKMKSFAQGHTAGKGFPGGSDGKESTCSAGGLGSIPGVG